jgi:hypothetical protein
LKTDPGDAQVFQLIYDQYGSSRTGRNF